MAFQMQVLLWMWATVVLLLVWETKIATSETIPDTIVGAKTALGKIVNLPRTNILDSLNSGHPLFTTHPESNTEPYSRGGSSLQYFQTSDKLKQHISSDANLDTSAASSLSVTMKTTFDLISDFETNVSVAKAYAESLVSVSYVTKEHLDKLTLRPDFLASFNALPITIANEWTPSAWYHAAEFLETWGTHVIVAAYTGATFDTYSIAKSSLDYSQQELEARACLHAEGFNQALRGCGGFSEAQKKNAATLSANDKRYAKGGSSTTRNQLLSQEVTKEVLDKFLSEAAVDEEPVKYHFMPLWSLLRSRYAARSEEWRRATNLGAYYDGWLGFGCRYVEMKENGVVEPAQWFRFNMNNIGYARCLRRCLGCHSDHQDCFNSNNVCMCSGPSCLVPTDESKHGYHVRVENNRRHALEGMGCEANEQGQCMCENKDSEVGCHVKLNQSSPIKYRAIWDQTPAMFRDLTTTFTSTLPQNTPAIISNAN